MLGGESKAVSGTSGRDAQRKRAREEAARRGSSASEADTTIGHAAEPLQQNNPMNKIAEGFASMQDAGSKMADMLTAFAKAEGQRSEADLLKAQTDRMRATTESKSTDLQMVQTALNAFPVGSDAHSQALEQLASLLRPPASMAPAHMHQ